MYAPRHRAWKYIKKQSTKLKGEIHKFTIIAA